MTRTMKRSVIYHAALRWGLPAALFLAAPAALAQSAGTYTGTNNEGQAVEVIVASDGSGGFYISGVSDGGTVYCKKSGTTYGYGVGVSGDLDEITDGKASYAALFTDLSISSTYKFSGSKVAGKLAFSVPILDTAKAAEACATKPQTYTATLSGPVSKFASKGAWAWPLTAQK